MARIINFLNLNDLNIKSFMGIVLSIQFATLGCTGLNILGEQTPILRQALSLINFVFITGFIFLRILKIHNINSTENILYAVGLGISTLMIMGLVTNLFFPIIGIFKPITANVFIIELSILIIILLIVAYIADKDFDKPTYFEVGEIVSSQLLFLIIYPLLAIWGTYLINNYNGNNILIYILLIALPLIPLLVAFDFISDRYYPMALFSASISLLFHNSLASMELVPWGDVVFEYYYSYNVLTNSIWDPTLSDNLNGMLSIVLLSPILSLLSDMQLSWTFKIFTPLIYSLVPLGIYRVLSQQTTNKLAFFSTFLFISNYAFFVTMLGMVRMQFGEIFLICIILLNINKSLTNIKISLLIIIFAFSMIVSHYALSYIFILLLVSALLLSYVLNIEMNQDKIRKILVLDSFQGHKSRLMRYEFVLVYIVLILSWYIYVSSSTPFISIVNLVHQVTANLISDFLKPESAQGMFLIINSPDTWVGKVLKLLFNVSQFFIIIGFIIYIRIDKIKRLNNFFFLLSVASLELLAATIFIPNFTGIGVQRIYHIALFFISYFSIIGMSYSVDWFVNTIGLSSLKNKYLSIKFISIFLSIFLLFNSSILYQLTDKPTSLPLNINKSPIPCFEKEEMNAGSWLIDKKNAGIEILTGFFNSHIFAMFTGSLPALQGEKDIVSLIPEKAYIFLGKRNLVMDELILEDPKKYRLNWTTISFRNSSLYRNIVNRDKIYMGGYTEIFS